MRRFFQMFAQNKRSITPLLWRRTERKAAAAFLAFWLTKYYLHTTLYVLRSLYTKYKVNWTFWACNLGVLLLLFSIHWFETSNFKSIWTKIRWNWEAKSPRLGKFGNLIVRRRAMGKSNYLANFVFFWKWMLIQKPRDDGHFLVSFNTFPFLSTLGVSRIR